ncbi:MAG: undecaprenyl-diphosphate phosphatase [Actinomycetota bacterium]
MSIVEAVVLGAVQGLTEFIPISSSGHLVIVPELFGWERPGLSFDVLLHAASLLALLIYFSGDLLDLARGIRHGSHGSKRLVALLAVGTVPAGLAGLLLADFFEDQFEDAKAAALQLLITAAVLVVAEWVSQRRDAAAAREGKPLRGTDDLGLHEAGAIGVAQALAIFPGISRSGSTIGTGLALGLSRDDAARFAFLLAIPALAGAAVVKIPDLGATSLTLGAGIAGFISSAVASYAAITGLIRYLKSNTLYPFAVYCVIASIIFTILL